MMVDMVVVVVVVVVNSVVDAAEEEASTSDSDTHADTTCTAGHTEVVVILVADAEIRNLVTKTMRHSKIKWAEARIIVPLAT